MRVRRLGVLVEVNCETDFVAKGDVFKELVADIAMQVPHYPFPHRTTPPGLLLRQQDIPELS